MLKEYELEDYVVDVGEHDADTLKKQSQKPPLQLWALAAVILSSVQRETQVYLNNVTSLPSSPYREKLRCT